MAGHRQSSAVCDGLLEPRCSSPATRSDPCCGDRVPALRALARGSRTACYGGLAAARRAGPVALDVDDESWESPPVLSRRQAAFVAAFFLPACGRIGDSYVVHLDPAFTTDEQASVVAALGSWDATVPVHFTVEIGPCSGIHGGQICVHASNHAEIAIKQSAVDGVGVGLTLREQTWGYAVDGGEVFFDMPTIEANYVTDFQRIAAHEIGHAMQLEHNAPGNLMAPMVTDDASAPTCTDDLQWFDVRGERAPACSE